MRANVATILVGMGHVLDRDFVVREKDDKTVQLVWKAATTAPTEAEIDAAAPAIEAAIAAEAADAAQWNTDRADLKAQYSAGVARLIDIRDNTTNITAIAAIKDLAAFQLRILKYIRRL